jgi:hypothetical protein
MPDEEGKDTSTEESIPDTSLHAYKDEKEDQIEGPLNEEGEPDADQVKNTGGATSGDPGGAADGEEDPSDV